jgi:hypothetical protein
MRAYLFFVLLFQSGLRLRGADFGTEGTAPRADDGIAEVTSGANAGGTKAPPQPIFPSPFGKLEVTSVVGEKEDTIIVRDKTTGETLASGLAYLPVLKGVVWLDARSFLVFEHLHRGNFLELVWMRSGRLVTSQIDIEPPYPAAYSVTTVRPHSKTVELVVKCVKYTENFHPIGYRKITLSVSRKTGEVIRKSARIITETAWDKMSPLFE